MTKLYEVPEGTALAFYGDVPRGVRFRLPDETTWRERGHGYPTFHRTTLVLVEWPPPFDWAAWIHKWHIFIDVNSQTDVALWREIQKVADHVEVRNPMMRNKIWMKPSNMPSGIEPDALFEVREA